MLKNRQSILIILWFCLLSGPAFAENLNLKPGLWEVTYISNTSGTPSIPAAQRAEMEKELAEMPPDKRADMRARMEAGWKSGMANAMKPVVRRICLSKDDVSKLSESFEGLRGDDGTCSRTVVKFTSSVYEMRVDCSKDKKKTSSTVRLLAPNSETLSGTMEGAIAPGGATGMNSKTTISGKRLGADCGNVKPSSGK